MHARRLGSETRHLSRWASATAAAILLCVALPSSRAQISDEMLSERWSLLFEERL